jgi:hypothetical protein
MGSPAAKHSRYHPHAIFLFSDLFQRQRAICDRIFVGFHIFGIMMPLSRPQEPFAE